MSDGNGVGRLEEALGAVHQQPPFHGRLRPAAWPRSLPIYRDIHRRDGGGPQRLPLAPRGLRCDLGWHPRCSAGRKFGTIDGAGDAHACYFWGHASLGDVRAQAFSAIWLQSDSGLLADLRAAQRRLTGRCAECSYRAYCGGCRIRAEALHGDPWGPDLACYLRDDEIHERVPPPEQALLGPRNR